LFTAGESPIIIVNQAIHDALEKQPFSSIRELAKLSGIPFVTVN
jgi:hypothetical protein